MHKSSLNEAAAAGILMLAGWDEKCGQGGGWVGDWAGARPLCLAV